MLLVIQILSILLVVISGVSSYLAPHLPLIWQVSGTLGLVGVIYLLWIERTQVMVSLSKKTTRYGLHSLFTSLVVVSIVIVINMIASNHDIKKDITKNRVHTLSEQSAKVVKALGFDVTLKVFVSPMQTAEFDSLIDKYTYLSPKVKKEYIDVDKDPMAVKQYNIKQTGAIIVESQSRTARIENLSGPEDPKAEEKITNAIIQVAKGNKKKAYYLTGHGERQLSDTGKEGFSESKEALESSRYEVVELALVQKDKIPDDAALVLIAGPKSDFMDHELKSLKNYLDSNGKVLFLMEPDSTPGLKAFLSQYGADWKPNKVVLETNPIQRLAGGNPVTPIITNYDKTHDITKDTKQLSIFAMATPVEKSATVSPEIKVTSLFSSSANSQEAQLKGQKLAMNEKGDRKGPLSLALAISGHVKKAEPSTPDKKENKKDEKKEEDEFRMVIVGDSDFACNGARRFGVNADLFQNMLSWLAKEEDLISIRPKDASLSELEITEERMRVIQLASIIFAPLLMFMSALGVYFNRRRK